MRRSEVNAILREGGQFIRSHGYILPPFATWTPDEMRNRREPGILQARLGWDVTDFGTEKFGETGLFLFTVRNGRAADLARGKGGMVYAEKIMIARDRQTTPVHRHRVKAEDIINRGGGRLVLELWNLGEDGGLARGREVRVATDGVERRLQPGERLALSPGESVTLLPGHWHGFHAEGGDVLIGEVSTVNDDLTDNVFFEPVGRFAAIDEDEPPLHLLVSDYDAMIGESAA